MYLYRLVHSVLFWVCIGLAVATPLLFVSIYAEMNAKYGTTISIASTLLSSIMGMDFLSWPLILGPAFISFFYALEWKDGTFRNQLLAGKSRTEIYLSSQIIGLLISLAVFVVFFFATLLLGLVYRMPFLLPSENAGDFCVSFAMMIFLGLFVTVVATSFAFIVHNAWGAFGCLIGFSFLLEMIMLLISLLEFYNVDNYYILKEWIYTYQISRFESLAFDATENLEGIEATGRTIPLILKTLASSLLGGGGLGFLGWLSFTKRDLK
jgi:ABC-type transport system involved in multi-copper enzyme maturation permease subunit